MTAVLAIAAMLSQQPVPRVFPQPATGDTQSRPAPPPPSRPSPPTVAPAAPAAATPPPATSKPAGICGASAPIPTLLGVPLYPGAQFIAAYEAGRGQCFYLYGSTAAFQDLVTYYRNQLKQKGDLVFEAPATHEFEIGRFREETMAFPPTVTIKEYKSELSEGYPNPKLGAQPARFPTVIQIVPATEK
jgi:hypothetical protein